LGNLPVLAEFAFYVAPGRGDRVGPASWKKVENRLLLDGVDVLGAKIGMNECEIGPFSVLAHAAISALAVRDLTFARAEAAYDLPVFLLIVISGLDRGFVPSGRRCEKLSIRSQGADPGKT